MQQEEKHKLIANIAGQILANNSQMKAVDLAIQDSTEPFHETIEMAVMLARDVVEITLASG